MERVAAGDIPPAVRRAAKAFMADTIGVGIAGMAAPWRQELLDMVSGGTGEATIWGSAARLAPLAQTGMVNAFQIHAQEFDAVHEGAVVHPMAASLPCLIGWAERDGGIAGDSLVRATIAAVDVAVTLGLCSRAPMRFFRPATCGGFGAVAGLAVLTGIGAEQTRDALGIYYGQCAGTMQAHVEASPQLAMQMGFAARNAIVAIELARRGVPGPRASISGEFGYFALFDGAADPSPFDQLGSAWRVCELSHKPFPSGRATHGGIDGLQRLLAAHHLTPGQIRAGRFIVPPLTHRLVGRPARAGMSVGYARLCLPYCGAVCLRRGTVGLDDFSPAGLADSETLALAERLSVVADANPDPNALLPQRVELELVDGSGLGCDVAEVLGSPARPLTDDAAQAKFIACCAAAAFDERQATELWNGTLAIDQAGGLPAMRPGVTSSTASPTNRQSSSPRP